jgi:pimeloyl-[acyl-carrier protein] methyl ester esterase
MHVDARGQGSLEFLFIHGFGGSSGVWAAQTEYFQTRGRVLTVDLPGHGQTPWNGQTLKDMAFELSQGLDEAGIKGPVCVVASSLGGLIALELWQKRPEIFRSLSFAGSVPRFTAVDGFPSGLSAVKIDKMKAQIEVDPGLTLDVFFRSLFTRQERESASYAWIKQLRVQMPVPSKDVLNTYLNILKITDAREILRSVNVPVQFILGDGDYICPEGIVGPLKQILPGARFDVIPDCGHLPFLSRPGEFNGLLRDFIK